MVSVHLMAGCERNDHAPDIESIMDTRWILASVINHKTHERTGFPEQLNPFEISFKRLGIIELTGFCNYSFGKYTLHRNDSLYISNLGPGTYKLCLPDLAMDWEELFIRNLRECESYHIIENQLTLKCNDDHDLVFDFVESFGDKIGKVLFCTNSHIINCPFQIEIFLGALPIDTLTAASAYSDDACYHDDLFFVGAIFEISEGSYNYYARELICQAENKINCWQGEIRVVRDSCTVVPLDIIP